MSDPEANKPETDLSFQAIAERTFPGNPEKQAALMADLEAALAAIRRNVTHFLMREAMDNEPGYHADWSGSAIKNVRNLISGLTTDDVFNPNRPISFEGMGEDMESFLKRLNYSDRS